MLAVVSQIGITCMFYKDTLHCFISIIKESFGKNRIGPPKTLLETTSSIVTEPLILTILLCPMKRIMHHQYSWLYIEQAKHGFVGITQSWESERFDFVGSFVPNFWYIWQKVIIILFFTDFLVCKRGSEDACEEHGSSGEDATAVLDVHGCALALSSLMQLKQTVLSPGNL